MIEIQEMSELEAEDLLGRVRYGHFACSANDQPYVVPIHYSYCKPFVLVYTTDGRKTEIIRDNPKICLQVEEVEDDGNWKSVVFTGLAERITEPADREDALKLIVHDNPNLAPAVSIKWRNNWIRENVEVIYRLRPVSVTGRRAVHVATSAAAYQGRHHSKLM